MAIVSFISDKPKIMVKLGGKDVQFQDGVLNLDTEKETDVLLIMEMRQKLADPEMSGMAQLIREMPTDAAVQMVEQHRQMEAVKHRSANGGLTSMSMDLQASATGATMGALDDSMRSQGATQEQIDAAAAELARDGLVTTQSTAGQEPHRANLEGFKPIGERVGGITLPVNSVIPIKPSPRLPIVKAPPALPTSGK